MAGGLVVDRFGPFACIDARDRLPSVEATREPGYSIVPLEPRRRRTIARGAVVGYEDGGCERIGRR